MVLDPCTFPLMPFVLVSVPSRYGRLVGSPIKHCKQIPTSRVVVWAACGPLLRNSIIPTFKLALYVMGVFVKQQIDF